MLTANENHVFLKDTARLILLHLDVQDKLYGDVLMNGRGREHGPRLLLAIFNIKDQNGSSP